MYKNYTDFYKTVILYSIVLLFGFIPIQLSGQQNFKEIKINDDLQIIQISPSFYIHVSWVNSENYGRFSSNGLILIKEGRALIIDTPFSKDLTESICNYLSNSMNVSVEKFIAGHSHGDCMGGIEVLHAKNVHSIALDLTKEKCKEQNLPLPKQVFSDSLVFNFYGEKVKCLYTGPGHTDDNISVYFPDSKILFGGCMIKSKYSKSLGNTKEAVIAEWDKSVEKLKNICNNAEVVVPGHGNVGDVKILEYTINLVKSHRK